MSHRACGHPPSANTLGKAWRGVVSDGISEFVQDKAGHHPAHRVAARFVAALRPISPPEIVAQGLWSYAFSTLPRSSAASRFEICMGQRSTVAKKLTIEWKEGYLSFLSHEFIISQSLGELQIAAI